MTDTIEESLGLHNEILDPATVDPAQLNELKETELMAYVVEKGGDKPDDDFSIGFSTTTPYIMRAGDIPRLDKLINQNTIKTYFSDSLIRVFRRVCRNGKRV